MRMEPGRRLRNVDRWITGHSGIQICFLIAYVSCFSVIFLFTFMKSIFEANMLLSQHILGMDGCYTILMS